MISISNTELDKIALKHYEAIREHLQRKRIKKYSPIDQWCRTNLHGLTLKEVILASPQELDALATNYRNFQSDNTIKYLRDTLYSTFSQSGQFIGDNGYNAVELVGNLGIKVCPYCNRNYINNIRMNKAGTKVRRTSQLDHYHSKDLYPFLAMSFYNLIPVCQSCNHLKSNKEISISPYHDFDVDKDIKFDFAIKNSSLMKESDLEVKVNYKKKFEKNVSILRLEEHYRYHNDVLYEVIRKKQMYPNTKVDELYDNFKELFDSREELIRILFGNHVQKDDISKRPLAKLTRDIFLNTNDL